MVPKILASKECKFEGCGWAIKAMGWCGSHYRQNSMGRGMHPVRRHAETEVERFWEKVNKDGPSPIGSSITGQCWMWASPMPSSGYGRFRGTWRGKPKYVLAHRYSYELAGGNIPDGLVIDHLCRNRACVNPGHLEPVTAVENTLRGTSFAPKNLTKTHCPQGHEYSKENTYLVLTGGRDCRTCSAETSRRSKARKKERLNNA